MFNGLFSINILTVQQPEGKMPTRGQRIQTSATGRREYESQANAGMADAQREACGPALP